MGWTFLYDAPHKQIVIDECTNPPHNGPSKCLKHSVKGNELWTIWERDGKKSIVLFLLAKSEGNWGYKDMDEAMNPYYYKCPLKFLNEVPVVNQEWRDKVIEYFNNKKTQIDCVRTISIGSVIRLRDSTPNRFVVVSTKPLIGADYTDGVDPINRQLYRIVKSRIIEVEDS